MLNIQEDTIPLPKQFCPEGIRRSHGSTQTQVHALTPIDDWRSIFDVHSPQHLLQPPCIEGLGWRAALRWSIQGAIGTQARRCHRQRKIALEIKNTHWPWIAARAAGGLADMQAV